MAKMGTHALSDSLNALFVAKMGAHSFSERMVALLVAQRAHTPSQTAWMSS